MLTGPRRLRHYLERFGTYPAQLAAEVAPDLGLIVVIPCYNEPDITTTLNSLWSCHRPSCAVEILVVVNGSSQAPDEAHLQNQATLDTVAAWGQKHNQPQLRCHGLHFPDLPAKHAGVGLARKVGLDEAIQRALGSSRPCVLLNLDADCQVAPNYLRAVETAFATEEPLAGACIYFEHPLEGDLPPENYRAIAQYELHLRAFVQGMRIAGHPCDFHTVGSTIALPAESYARIGGMNKRRGGEDFYFLQKLAQSGHIININDTCVIPSSRLSDRNPFGTGPALTHMVGESDKTADLYTYHPDAYHALAPLIDGLPALFRAPLDAIGTSDDPLHALGLRPSLRDFLAQHNIDERRRSIHQNTATEASFCKQMLHWFNGFLVVKWVHYFRDHDTANLPIAEAAQALLPASFQPSTLDPEWPERALLDAFRRLDRQDHRLPSAA